MLSDFSLSLNKKIINVRNLDILFSRQDIMHIIGKDVILEMSQADPQPAN